MCGGCHIRCVCRVGVDARPHFQEMVRRGGIEPPASAPGSGTAADKTYLPLTLVPKPGSAVTPHQRKRNS